MAKKEGENKKKKRKKEEPNTISEQFEELMFRKKKKEASSLIANHIIKTNFIYTIKDDNRTEVWIYKNGIYVPNGKCEIKILIKKLIDDFFSPFFVNEILSKIEIETMINQEEFFAHLSSKKFLHLIPIKDGLFNIITKKIEPFNPEIIFTTRIPINYNPNAKCPEIEKFLKDVLDTEENINLFYEIAGFCLYRDYFIEKATIFDGFGRNGKTKTQELLRCFIGAENSCAVPLSQLTEDSFSTSELFNKHINIAGDLSNTNLKDTSTLQKTIGRDCFNAKRKFMTDIKFVNFAKHIFSENELPKVYVTHRGFWDKWTFISFFNTFVEQKEFDTLSEEEKKRKKLLDPDILKKITTEKELEGLFIKALNGLETIRKNKQFSYNQSSEQIKDNWVRKSDSFFSFAIENIESTDDHTTMIPKVEIRRMYHQYCSEYKIKGCSDIVIKITLQEQFGADEYRNHEQQTFWTGIKIKLNSKYIKKPKNSEEIKKQIKNKEEEIKILNEKFNEKTKEEEFEKPKIEKVK